MTAVLRGIGTAVPRSDLPQERAAELAADLMGLTDRRRRALATLYGQTGVETRGTEIADGGEPNFFLPGVPDPTTDARLVRYRAVAPDLAAEACADALARSGVPAGAITHLVTVSCTGFHAPGVDLELVRALGLSPGVQRTAVGFMGCHGAINGLRVADAFARADPDARVLVCCVEVCSVHFQYEPVEGAVTANALFGDGAAACVVAGRGDGPRIHGFGAEVFADSAGEMGWRIGDHGFVMTLSARVPGLLAAKVGPWVDAWLAGQGTDRASVRSWAVHPGGPRIVEGVRGSLGLGSDAVADALEVLRTHGNMSSPTVLFIIRRMLDRGAPLPLAALAFGPGLAGEAMLVDA